MSQKSIYRLQRKFMKNVHFLYKNNRKWLIFIKNNQKKQKIDYFLNEGIRLKRALCFALNLGILFSLKANF